MIKNNREGLKKLYILGIDSSTKKLIIGINKELNLLAKVEIISDKGFMINIITLIDKLLKKTKLNLSLIDNFCVNIGPGDFTGTRIGITVAKTFGLVENKNVVGISTLDVFGFQVFLNNFSEISNKLLKGREILIIPVLDVKREELFFSVYRAKLELLKSKDYFEEWWKKYCKDEDCKNKDYKNEEKIAGDIIGFKDFKGSLIYLEKVSQDFLVDNKNFQNMLSEKLNKIKNFVIADIYLCGTAFNFYKNLYSAIKKYKTFSTNKLDFFLDKNSTVPDIKALNLCAYFKIKKEIAAFKTNSNMSISSAHSVSAHNAHNVSACNASAYNASGYNNVFSDYKARRIVPYYVRDFIHFENKK